MDGLGWKYVHNVNTEKKTNNEYYVSMPYSTHSAVNL